MTSVDAAKSIFRQGLGAKVAGKSASYLYTMCTVVKVAGKLVLYLYIICTVVNVDALLV